MGLVGYVDRDNDIIQDRLSNRKEKIENEYKAWNRDKERIIVISESINSKNNKSRIKELLDIKESLQCKINLSLSVISSMDKNAVRFIAESLNLGLEDSYSKVRETIRLIDGYENVSYSPQISVEDIKKNLVRNMFYRVENMINNVEEISTEDMVSIKKDLLKLINWFYDKEFYNGKIVSGKVDYETTNKFLKEELDTFFCKCPVCGKDTVDGIKFSIECAEELK